MALIGATMIALSKGGSTAATITVHPPDGGHTWTSGSSITFPQLSAFRAARHFRM
jgi:hypothetical protein